MFLHEYDGDLELEYCADGELGIVEQIYANLDYYTGPTVVTPTRETQILITTGKTVAEDITIEPIPQNYGLITWNGQKLTVS